MADSPFQYCPRCGAPGGQWRDGHEYRCPLCGFRFFQNVATACGALVEHEGRYLFLERAKDPSKGKWGLPGGFVDPGESAEDALAREISEEIGGVLDSATFLVSFPNVYRFAGVEYATCDLYFRVTLSGSPESLRADPGEVSRLVWCRPEDVRPENLAFDSLRALWASLRGPGVSQ